MRCKVKVNAADGSSTIASTLINPGSSALFIHERRAQHLQYIYHGWRQNYNAIVEGVAGASTRSQFHMVPGIWHWERCGESQGKSICARNIIKDLRLYPIPVALKWDHLSELKLAYSDFCRTPWGLKYYKHTLWWQVNRTSRHTISKLIHALDGCFLRKLKVAMWYMWETTP